LATEIALPDSQDSKYFPPKTEDGYDMSFLLGFYNGLLEQVRAMTGGDSAATIWMLPFTGRGWQPYFHVEGWPEEEPGEAAVAEGNSISPGYFRTMGIPLIAGRDFSVHDTADTPLVAIVDERIAARYWPGEYPLGKRLKLGDHASDRPWLEVIGVVGHVKFKGVQKEARSQIYIPEMQHYNGLFRYSIVARTTGEPTALMEPIRRMVMALDPDLPVSSFRTMEDYVGSTTQQGRLVAGLLGIFAATALILAGGDDPSAGHDVGRDRCCPGAHPIDDPLTAGQEPTLRRHPPRSRNVLRCVHVPVRRGDDRERAARIPRNHGGPDA
jgi:hypothetical protein